MNTPPVQTPSRPFGLTPVVVGTAYCLAAAALYTGVNVCLRLLAGQAYQPWVICVKEFVTVAAVGPWLLSQTLHGRRVWPAPRALAALVLVGLAVQLIGNLAMLWALEVVGLSITIPTAIAVNLTASAALGWLLLHEALTRRLLAAVALLIVAVGLLHLGVGQWNVAATDPARLACGVGAACLAGLTFAALAVTIRQNVTAAVPPATVVFIITGMGVVTMGPLSLWRLGWNPVQATSPSLLALMLLAGLLNFAAFLAISRGYQYASVVRANVLNTSQAALAAVIGMLFFLEAPRPAILLGIGLTLVGTILADSPRSERDS